jgi:hypothetical protein
MCNFLKQCLFIEPCNETGPAIITTHAAWEVGRVGYLATNVTLFLLVSFVTFHFIISVLNWNCLNKIQLL